jgi:serine/threonine-protein kinase RsbT
MRGWNFSAGKISQQMFDKLVFRQAIIQDSDIVSVRQQGRAMAAKLKFGRADQALIATAISELARNIVSYAKRGEIEITEIVLGRRSGLQVVARDQGPGIADLNAAMTDGFSTGNSLGLGLPGTKRIVDQFDIQSAPGQGVTVRIVKWIR